MLARIHLLGLLAALPACGVPVGVLGEDDRAKLPNTEACAGVSEWDGAWSAWEDELRGAVLDARSDRLRCEGDPPLPADLSLTRDGHLRCAARLHAQDMAARDYFDHFAPDTVEGPGERVMAAGGDAPHVVELLAADLTTPAQAIDLWRARPGTCSDLMDAGVTDIGVGYYGGPEGTYDGYAVVLLAGPGDGNGTGTGGTTGP